ncbi:MAG: SDR family oxidoreductase [Actinomycetota bacterium]|nr:SDR family oxidoreductase [Actinomycetota bacterium]MDD5667641.1 SDR family oxidoreductase [Actinomycetota bacterium]
MKIKDFEGKNVYVVGGSSGIGLSAAEILAQRGSNVILFARGRERLEEALEKVTARRKNESQRFTFKQLDISDHEEVEKVMAEAVEGFGPPDILINSAGRALPDYFENISYEQLDESMKLHLYGNWNTIKALLPHLKQRRGYITNVCSVVGFVGPFGYTDYAASKFALMGLTEALRSELKPCGVGVSILCPPDTDTPGFEVENRNKPPETAAVSEGGGLMRPERVAQALIKGMEKGKFVITPGSAKMIYVLKRHFPWLVDYVMDREIRKLRKGKAAS